MSQFDEIPWTAKLDSEIRKLALNGWTTKQIALRMRRTPASIVGRARKLRIDLANELESSWRQGAVPTKDR